jgi:AraC-like DNA-binding protein
MRGGGTPGRAPARSSLAHPRVMIFEERPVQVIHTIWDRPCPRSYDMHLGLELGIVLRGEMIRHLNGGSRSHGPGEMWFHDLWESHGWEVRTAPTEAVILIIRPQALQQMRFPEAPGFSFLHPFSLPHAQRPRVPAPLRAEVLSIASRLLDCAASDSPLAALRIRVLLMRAILTACGDWSPRDEDPSQRRVPQKSIEPALRLVADARRFTPVADAAAACGMGVKAFRGAFKVLMGIAFSRYALKYRVDGVALQLLQGRDPVKAIAADWGFTDTSHLDRSFHRFYGCFPTEYRARHRV